MQAVIDTKNWHVQLREVSAGAKETYAEGVPLDDNSIILVTHNTLSNGGKI